MYKELIAELRDYDGPVIYEDADGQHVERTAVDITERAAEAIERLLSELERVTRERDAAVEDFRMHRKYKCDGCYYSEYKSEFSPCRDCQSPISNYGDGWQWRGVTDTSKEG